MSSIPHPPSAPPEAFASPPGARLGSPPHPVNLPGAATGAQAAQLPPQHAPPAGLADEFRAVLQAGVHGLCFSPYLEGQAPGSQVSEAQIRERLARIQPHTRWVRTFSCTDGHQHTPRIAHELGLKTLVGAWLGTDRDINQRELDAVIALAQAGHADIVAIGNEVLLREDLSEDELLACLERVKQALPGEIGRASCRERVCLAV